MSRFADFIRNASDEEREQVFLEVMETASAEQRAVVLRALSKRCPEGCTNGWHHGAADVKNGTYGMKSVPCGTCWGK